MSKKKKAHADSTATESKDPSAPQTKAPRERWQRGCEKQELYVLEGAPTRSQRVYDAVRRLEHEGRITGAQYTAAQRWIADYERNQTSAAPDLRTASIRSSSSGPEARLASGVDAATRVYEVRVKLGEPAHRLLVSTLHLGLSLRGVARSRAEAAARATRVAGELPRVAEPGGRELRKIGDELADVLEQLAAHQQEADRRGYRGMLSVQRPTLRRAA